MVVIWRDLDTLKALSAEDWRDAHVHADEAELMKARRISHYEVVEG